MSKWVFFSTGQTSAAGATAGSIRGMGGGVGSVSGAAEAALAAPGTRNDSGATTKPSAKRVSSPSVFGDFHLEAGVGGGVGAGAGGATDRRERKRQTGSDRKSTRLNS